MNRGLIEALPEFTQLELDALLPRFMNRGLIEAPFDVVCNPLSESLPRFMNRGLIEAAHMGGRARCHTAYFPDS